MRWYLHISNLFATKLVFRKKQTDTKRWVAILRLDSPCSLCVNGHAPFFPVFAAFFLAILLTFSGCEGWRLSFSRSGLVGGAPPAQKFCLCEPSIFCFAGPTPPRAPSSNETQYSPLFRLRPSGVITPENEVYRGACGASPFLQWLWPLLWISGYRA